jgi:microsomal epoxide hydrolase
MSRNEDPVAIEPFTIAIDDAILADLQSRLRRTIWPPRIFGPNWEHGADQEYLRTLLATWANQFDWRRREAELNQLSHYLADIDGLKIHFVHERGNGPSPMPIVLTHGFPSSFVEHLDLMPLLTDPASHGGRAEDAFDVIVTSLPGYGFS